MWKYWLVQKNLLSSNTIESKISDMAEVFQNIQKFMYFALQLDEPTDICNCVQFIAYLRYEKIDTR